LNPLGQAWSERQAAGRLNTAHSDCGRWLAQIHPGAAGQREAPAPAGAAVLGFAVASIKTSSPDMAWHRASGQKRSNLKKAFFSFFLLSEDNYLIFENSQKPLFSVIPKNPRGIIQMSRRSRLLLDIVNTVPVFQPIRRTRWLTMQNIRLTMITIDL
jgi:hypothetical protein